MKKIIAVTIISVALLITLSLIIPSNATEIKKYDDNGEWIELTDGRIVRVQK
ncbi:hypothetical protein [Orenia marismortui]|uniref:hypothetical protein n=1 Tax=Orenia marismortui TaxID=46469 RepID=UPI00036866F1|nr:hypothetical protein [Orenia marismortui]